ncbi:hypothetical protein F4820DRAFT_465344 [Hypoxylon rubiginosum]|uniref:Uncharacterized protein n=1 Tax=Hypoxylon rubiginosum TaxID=110542 RepID=A0ACB9YP70_9PEZI|nr:hypothetical protein F4820DRAFT_465344 [Hypoxylon rubiginosum]
MRVAQASKTAKATKPSKASKQARVCGLSVNTTHNQVDSPVQSARGEENITQASSPMQHKERLEGINAKSFASKKMAILNDNWRSKQFERHGGVPLPPATAAPDRTEFHPTKAKKNAKKLSIDTGRAGEYGVRRYRDTPIDPDFIFSAPITKKDYKESHDEIEAHHTEEPQEPISNATAPTPSSATKQLEVPMSAGVKAFKTAKQLHWNKWDTLPHTAGLPVDRLRIELDQAVALKAILEEELLEISPPGGGLPKKDEDVRFSALIAKLQKPTLAGARHRRVQSFIDIKPPHWTKESGKCGTQCKSPSQDSAISGVPDEDVKKGPTLNPQATEFRSSISPNASIPSKNLNNYQQEERKENSSQQATFCNDSSLKNNGSSNNSALVEEMRAVNARMLEIMEEMKQMKAHQLTLQHYSHPIEQNSNLALINQSQYSQAQGPASFGQYGAETWPAIQSYNAPHHSMQQPQLPYVSQNMGPNGGMPPVQAPYVGPSQALQLHRTSSPLRPRAPVAPMTVGCQAGHGSMPLHAQAQMIFGPKPMSKPRGDFRPGDPRAAAAQVAYENYLEQKRASNLNYAMQCRERQARRAERQRTTIEGANTAPNALLQGPQANGQAF